MDILDQLSTCIEYKLCSTCPLKCKCNGYDQLFVDAATEIEKLRAEKDSLSSEIWGLQVELEYAQQEG